MQSRKARRNLYVGAAFLAALAVVAVTQGALERAAAAQGRNGVQAPRFEVDPFWPKPLPNHWVVGSIIGVSVDAQDHVWIVHRTQALNANERAAEVNPPTGECCRTAPDVLEFDQAGNLLRHWGGKDGDNYQWPSSNHGIHVDYKGNVWLGGNGGGREPVMDGLIVKFTGDGKFLLQVGKRAVPIDSSSTEHFAKATKVFVDKATNEAYVADGYGNHRVAVLDADTGKFKRIWGAYGNKPTDENLGRYDPNAPPAQQFRSAVHCAEVSNDAMVYVCDRINNRIQVFTREGKFIKEGIFAKQTLGAGSAWDIAFSRDAQQKYIYLADGTNEKVYIIERQSLQELTSFGDGGRQPGQFFGTHSIATDSKGNIYTTETYEGKRVQRFIYKGIGPVTKQNQGVLWPRSVTTN
jgi:hypothetical protein